MRFPLVAAMLAIHAAVAALAAPAVADAPPDRSFARRPVPSRSAADIRHGYGPDRVVRHHVRRQGARVGRFVPAEPGYGPEPALYPGYGGASPNAGFGFGQPVAVTLYREAYIGPGLIYNTPPEPHWPSSEVISVRY